MISPFLTRRWYYSFALSQIVNMAHRADSRFAPSQWETALLCNDTSYWLDTSLESALGPKKKPISPSTLPQCLATSSHHNRHRLPRLAALHHDVVMATQQVVAVWEDILPFAIGGHWQRTIWPGKGINSLMSAVTTTVYKWVCFETIQIQTH